MTSFWFSVSINMQGGGEVFRGIFRVDNSTDIITEFYQMIDGNADFTNNSLIPICGLERNDNIYISPGQYFSNNGIGVRLNSNFVISGDKIVSLLLHYTEIKITPSLSFYEYIRFYYDDNAYRINNNYTYTITPYNGPTLN
jgi:hypothetical protein